MKFQSLGIIVLGTITLTSGVGAQTGTPPTTDGPSVEERVSGAESRLTALERLGLSGYVQTRAIYQNDAIPQTNLFVRRARLSFRHTIDRGRLAISIDGGQNAVTVNDAYFDMNIVAGRGQRKGAVLRAGQFFRPIGFEIERPEFVRELPERPAGWTVLFPGLRDQGFDISVGLAAAALLDVAIVNGGGTSSPTLSFRDADDHKDVMARLQYALFRPRIDLAVSYYSGQQTIPGTVAQPAQLGFVDQNGNGAQESGEPTVVVVPAKSAKPAIEGDRDRWGVALNVYDLLGGTLRGEYIGAEDLTTNLSPGPSQETATAYAYYLQYVRYIAEGVTLGARLDCYDPDVNDNVRLGDDGYRRTVGLVAMRSIGENIRFSLAWEKPRITSYNKTSNLVSYQDEPIWTAQALYRF